MQLLDINFTMFGPDDRDADRNSLYEFADQLGDLAWTSESQFYLLTQLDAVAAHNQLRYLMRGTDFLKVQTVCGPFALTGTFPPRVNEVLEEAHRLGVIHLSFSKDADVDLLMRLLGR